LRGFGSRFNFLQRWIRTGSENPTVSYCKTLQISLEKTNKKVGNSYFAVLLWTAKNKE